MIGNTKNTEKNALFMFVLNLQAVLYKLGLLLMIVLISIQILHYYHVFQEMLSPAYSLGGNLTGRDTPTSSYSFFYFTANTKNDDIMIRINGIPVKRIEKDKFTFVCISPLDILEIDATKAYGAYEVIIKAEPTSFLPQGYNKRLRVQGKLYRISPLY